MSSTLGGLEAEKPCSISFCTTPSANSSAKPRSALDKASNALYIAFEILSLLKFATVPFRLRISPIEFSICE